MVPLVYGRPNEGLSGHVNLGKCILEEPNSSPKIACDVQSALASWLKA